ncbi:MAG: ATP-dependent DNA helicase RecG [Candidatus Firestonebacteria bacterium RIFOXYC2_FULL_39_67]|nr:MAG: ATP-dependent DNA helicase RecG [Candidatus Firestonebacteria bacterium RIFOXYD2_FULL_39_29]OGF53899.1 MAG: ATP-dependent DNA helicase RecG [Candidatus Firestonebacteria bacterium RIFOXYC2_FULL_39_67]
MTDEELRYIKGVGPVKASSLKRIGVKSVKDLLFFFPRWHVHKSRITPVSSIESGGKYFIKGRISGLEELRKPGRNILKVLIEDESGGTLTWIWYNRPYMKPALLAGRRVVIWDTVENTRWGKQITASNDSFEFIEEFENKAIAEGEILSFYKTTKILTNVFFREVMAELIKNNLVDIHEILSPELTSKRDLYIIKEAVLNIHFPKNLCDLEKARQRLVFNELLILQLFLAKRKKYFGKKVKNRNYIINPSIIEKIISKIGFTLTGAQVRVLEDIRKDLLKKSPMNRLLQGDVGSGKTIVALLALIPVLENNYQAAVMAPTEILAEQHYATFKKIFSLTGYDKSILLLTSKITAKVRRESLAAIADGKVSLVIGTHALLQEDVAFKNLGFVVIDERHKFGVFQRLALEAKGVFPDALMMTATPFPRALVLTLYGDTDLSVIDELPPGRQPIYTKWQPEKKRQEVYGFISQRLKAGEQVYIVYPLVEESSKSLLKAAEQEALQLQNIVFKDYKVGLIHGRMSSEEKEAVMNDFKSKKINILVSTTVIEVGIDVSNATIMLIEHAERFGLAQLHQLRGRVGRGTARSYCYLMTGWLQSSDSFKRMRIMEQINDGFKIAEADLDIRGPGELFGANQHGELDLKLINLEKDRELLEMAREEAHNIIEQDPDFKKQENIKLGVFFKERFSKDLEMITIS